MKKLFNSLLCATMSFTLLTQLSSQEWTNYHDLTCHDFTDMKFEVMAQHDHISKAKFRHPHHKKGHLKFDVSRTLATYSHRFDRSNDFNYAIGFSSTKLDWDKNPYFDQTRFNNLMVSFGWVNVAVERWMWRANITANMNTKHSSQLARYTFFEGVLRGRYALSEKMGLHTGIVGCTGLHYTRVLPVFGIDYAYSDKWMFKAILPWVFSAIYTVNSNLSFEAATRFFLTRQRLGEHETSRKRGLVAYRNAGIELGANYRTLGHIIANAHIGYSGEGRMRIGNRNDSHRRHFKVKPAGYWGAELVLSF